MKEITVTGYCDGNHEDKIRSVVERTLSVDGSKPVLLDLCDTCDALVSGLMVLMERGVVVKEPGKKKVSDGPIKKAAAKKPEPPRPTRGTYHEPTGKVPPLEGPHICPECGFESKSRSALGQHLTVTHSKGFRDYAGSDAA
jgi:hypothetical protein